MFRVAERHVGAGGGVCIPLWPFGKRFFARSFRRPPDGGRALRRRRKRDSRSQSGAEDPLPALQVHVSGALERGGARCHRERPIQVDVCFFLREGV